MLLSDLFEDKVPTMADRLQQAAIDFLTPLVAHKVPFITVQQVIDELRRSRPGILVDRALMMSLLDPTKIEVVKSIEGDRVNLQAVSEIDREVDQDQAEKEVNKIKDMAKKKAKSDIKNK